MWKQEISAVASKYAISKYKRHAVIQLSRDVFVRNRTSHEFNRDGK